MFKKKISWKKEDKQWLNDMRQKAIWHLMSESNRITLMSVLRFYIFDIVNKIK